MRAISVLRFAILAVAACGTPPPDYEIDAGACVPYVVPSGTDLMNPAVSFANDVLPIFLTPYETIACTSAACHGVTSGASGNLFLGMSAGDASTVFGELVGKPSGELTSMNFVTASDAPHSYLMHKMDGDTCMYDCSGSDCSVTMPLNAPILPVETRDIVRRWITQGAQSN
jgi:hypothetical protein